jgi:Rod binding domain-containing protein
MDMNIDKVLMSQAYGNSDIKKLSNIVRDDIVDMEDEKRKEVAKDFEAIFVRQIMDKMKDTIPESEDEESSSKQLKSMYWSFMSDMVGKQGGFGLWQNIYKSMPGAKTGEANQPPNQSGGLNEMI